LIFHCPILKSSSNKLTNLSSSDLQPNANPLMV
jgi:hypothetical protein